MSDNVGNLSETLPTTAENEEIKSSEQVPLAPSALASPSSKETSSVTSTENTVGDLVSTVKEEETIKTATTTDAVDITKEGAAEADNSIQNLGEKSSTEKVKEERESTEADSTTPVPVNTFSKEQEEEPLKTPKPTAAAQTSDVISSDLEGAEQVPEQTCLQGQEKETNAPEGSEDEVATADSPDKVSINVCSAEPEDATSNILKSTSDVESGKERLTDVEVASTQAVTGSVEENQSDAGNLPTPTDTEDQESNKDPKTPNTTDKNNKILSSSPTASTDEGVDVNYAEHMTYDSDGSAIYEDPNTKYRYKWSSTDNNWMPCDSNNTAGTASTANPYENDHYKWCTETQKWIPKVQSQTTETEHYKWDAERREWIPKVKTANTNTKSNTDPSNVTYDIDEDGQRIYTDKDGTVFFWDTTKNAWFPKIDDDFMAHYQMNYGFIDNTSASEEEKRRKAEEEEKLKELELQRMTEEAKAGAEAMAKGNIDGSANAGSGSKRKAQEPPKWFEINPDQNTKVYVSNLPLDITLDEFTELMSKCGMIMRDQQTQKYKIKLYAEPDGQLKGDGLCDYIKVESVGLALNILDEYNLRGNKIRVQRAEFQMRGEYNPALKPKRKKKDKEKLQKMKEKLFDWRPEKMRGERSKNEKVVIIKNLFDPSIFEKEVQLILDYQNDLREECSKCGTVRKVVIYDRHPEGVAQINMADPEEADVVIQMMQGRYFGQRQLSAEHWDGKTKYKVVESEAEVQKRLNNWDQYLTQEENERKIEEAKSQVAAEENELCKASEGASNAQAAIEEAVLSAANVAVKDKEEDNIDDCVSNSEISEPNEIKVMES